MFKLVETTRLDRFSNELWSSNWLLLFWMNIIFYTSVILIIILLTLDPVGMLEIHLLPIVFVQIVIENINILILHVFELILLYLVMRHVIIGFHRLWSLFKYPVFLSEWETHLLAEARLAWCRVLSYVASLGIWNLTLTLYLVLFFTWFGQMPEFSGFKIELQKAQALFFLSFLARLLLCYLELVEHIQQALRCTIRGKTRWLLPNMLTLPVSAL